MNMRTWRKIENQGRQLFKLYLPRISERNGPICCYRVYLIKLPPQKTVADLPPPEDIAVYSYQYAHSSPTGGAYIVESFDSDQLSTEIFLGDGESANGGVMCNKCFGLRPKPAPPLLHFIPEAQTTTSTSNATITILSGMTTVTKPTMPANSSNTTTGIPTTSAIPITSTTVAGIDTTTALPMMNGTMEKIGRLKREDSSAQKASVYGSMESSFFLPHDGFLDETSNYSGFIEVIGTYQSLID